MAYTQQQFNSNDVWKLYDAFLNGTVYTQSQFNSNDFYKLYTALVGGGGGGGVASVTGNVVDNTDPENPIIAIEADNITIQGDGSAGNPLQVTPGLFGEIVDTNDETGQTVSIDGLASFQPTAIGNFRISGYINLTTGTGNVGASVTYTDINGNNATKNITLTNDIGATGAALATTQGNYQFLDFTVRADITTPINVNIGHSAGTFDAGATIEQLS